MLLTPEHQEGRDFEEGDGAGEMDGGKEGIERLRKALGYYFPEYRQLNQTLQRDRPLSQPRPDPDPRRKRKRPRTAKETVGPLIPFTPASLLADPTISLLGGLILEREARARVKRLKRDILSSSNSYSHSTSSQSQIQEEYTSRRHLYKQTSSLLTPPEKERGLRGMITTALREMAEAGEIVQVRLETAFTPFLSARAHPDSDNAGDTSAYLPLPPPLLFPLLFPLFLSLQSQPQARSQRRTNPHHARPPPPPPPLTTTTTTLTKTLTQWGKDGRWERVTSEIVQAGMYWAQERGWVDKRGEGWVLGDAYDWV